MIEIIVAVIGSGTLTGVFTSILTYTITKKKETRVDYQTFFQKYEDQIRNLKTNHEKEIAELKERLSEVEYRVTNYEFYLVEKGEGDYVKEIRKKAKAKKINFKMEIKISNPIPKSCVALQANFYDYCLCEAVKIEINKTKFTVPKGFVTDFASVPRFWTRLVPRNGRDQIAFLVHDFMYLNHSYFSSKEFSRRDIDNIMLRLMKDMNASKFRQFVTYWSVRLFGWKYYNQIAMPGDNNFKFLLNQ